MRKNHSNAKNPSERSGGFFSYWLFLVLDYEIMLVFGGAAEQVEVP